MNGTIYWMNLASSTDSAGAKLWVPGGHTTFIRFTKSDEIDLAW